MRSAQKIRSEKHKTNPQAIRVEKSFCSTSHIKLGFAMREHQISDTNRYNDEIYYFLKDHLGGTNVVVDETGTVVSETMYDAFGEVRYESGSQVTDIGYTGQRQEDSLDLYFYNARWYDPALGRFAQADLLISNPYSTFSYDRFSYVSNNPCRFTDPSGYFTCQINMQGASLYNGQIPDASGYWDCENWITDLLTELQKSETGAEIYQDFLEMEDKWSDNGGIVFIIGDYENWGYVPYDISRPPEIHISIHDFNFDNMSIDRISSLAHELTHLGQHINGYSGKTVGSEYEAGITQGVVFQELTALPEYSQYNWEQSESAILIGWAVDALRINHANAPGLHFGYEGMDYMDGKLNGGGQFSPTPLSEMLSRRFLYITSYDLIKNFGIK